MTIDRFVNSKERDKRSETALLLKWQAFYLTPQSFQKRLIADGVPSLESRHDLAAKLASACLVLS